MQRPVRIALVVAYATFLVHSGLTLLLLPWSPLWQRIVLAAPGGVARWLGEGLVRGMISAVGVLCFVLLVAEFLWGVVAGPPRA